MKLYRLRVVEVRLKPRLNVGVGASLGIRTTAKSGIESEEMVVYLEDAQARVLAEVAKYYKTPLQLKSANTVSVLQQMIEGIAIEDIATGFLVKTEDGANIKMAPWMSDWKRLKAGELILECEMPIRNSIDYAGTICGNCNPCLVFRDTLPEDYQSGAYKRYSKSNSSHQECSGCAKCK